MKRNFGSLLEQLTISIQAALKHPNATSRYLSCIEAAEAAIIQSKEAIRMDPFHSREEEIHHFKREAPELYSQLFYYLTLVQLEAERPYADGPHWQASLRQKQDRLEEYFHLHDTIHRYYNQGSSHQDDHLFLRRPEGQWMGKELGAFIPPDFTIGAYWFSWIKANQRLRDWIREEITTIDGGNSSPPKPARLRWLGSRVDAIILFYALHLGGYFEIKTFKEVMEWVEHYLDIKLGQYYVALDELSDSKDPLKLFKHLAGLIKRKFLAKLSKSKH